MNEKKERRCQRKVVSKEVNALRKMRELKGFSRKEAAPLVGVTHKLIEQLENGRVELSKKKIVQYCNAYGFSLSQFGDICDGKVGKIKKEMCPNRMKVIEQKHLRRSYKKLLTKEVSVLKVLRKLKRISQYEGSFLCGYSKPTIGHIENGRIELSEVRIEHIVKSYGFTMDVYNHHLQSEKFITDIQDECIGVIQKLSEEQLKAVYPLLLTFNK